MSEEIDYKSAYESVLILKDMLIKENQELKEQIILLQASEPMLELTKYYGERDKYKFVLDEIREYIEKHKIEWIDEKFDKHNIMVKFNEYANPQAIIDMIDKVQL